MTKTELIQALQDYPDMDICTCTMCKEEFKTVDVDHCQYCHENVGSLFDNQFAIIGDMDEKNR